MKTYLVNFTGRKAGAIGVMRPCAVKVRAESPNDAHMRIYDTHEHITGVRVDEISPYTDGGGFGGNTP